MSGPDRQHRNHVAFAQFSDLGGDTWLLHEVNRIGAGQ
jgi:hypothetical protein